ncbi:MAG: radical SAM protein [Nanoarchaeota archaeon]|nr:radical SAM protein [Nanoarchaeota archaeon]
MACIEKIYSVSALMGNGACNAHCDFCAGKIHRRYSPKKDGDLDEELVKKTLTDCYYAGARSLSLTSSGEPTLSPVSVSRVLEIVHDLSFRGLDFPKINLYSNGIRIGQDEEFCQTYLGLWKRLGLTSVYITVHDLDERRNAEIYRINKYPSLQTVFDNIHGADLSVRSNIVLSKKNIGDFKRFKEMVEGLFDLGSDFISAWPIRDDNDEVNLDLAPNKEELTRMGGL